MMQTCPLCHGRQWLWVAKTLVEALDDQELAVQYALPCSRCDGTGEIEAEHDQCGNF